MSASCGVTAQGKAGYRSCEHWEAHHIDGSRGVLLGVATLVAEDQGFPTSGVNEAISSLFIVVAVIGFFATPLAVGRWWVVLSMAGPALALLIMQLANVRVTLDDGTGAAINYRTIYQFVALSLVMLAVSGVRLLFVTHQSDQPG